MSKIPKASLFRFALFVFVALSLLVWLLTHTYGCVAHEAVKMLADIPISATVAGVAVSTETGKIVDNQGTVNAITFAGGYGSTAVLLVVWWIGRRRSKARLRAVGRLVAFTARLPHSEREGVRRMVCAKEIHGSNECSCDRVEGIINWVVKHPHKGGIRPKGPPPPMPEEAKRGRK